MDNEAGIAGGPSRTTTTTSTEPQLRMDRTERLYRISQLLASRRSVPFRMFAEELEPRSSATSSTSAAGCTHPSSGIAMRGDIVWRLKRAMPG